MAEVIERDGRDYEVTRLGCGCSIQVCRCGCDNDPELHECDTHAAAGDLLRFAKAAVARIDGVWDADELAAWGPLMVDPVDDIARWARAVIAKVKG